MKPVICLKNVFGVIVFIGVSCTAAHTWKLLRSVHRSPSESIESIVFFNPDDGIATAGHQLLKTVDGGLSWSAISSNDFVYQKIVRNSDVEAFIIASSAVIESTRDSADQSGAQRMQPALIITRNKGGDWKNLDIPKSLTNNGFHSFNALCQTQNGDLWIAADAGIVHAKLTNESALQPLDVLPTDEAFIDIDCNTDGGPTALGVKGSLVQYTQSWTHRHLPISQGDTTVWARIVSSENVYQVVGFRSTGDVNRKSSTFAGSLLQSFDEGRTWTDASPPQATGLTDIQAIGAETWLIGTGGAIYHSAGKGRPWDKMSTQTEANLFAIFFLDSTHGWAAGEDGTVLKYD